MLYYIVKSPYFSVLGAIMPQNNTAFRQSTLKLSPYNYHREVIMPKPILPESLREKIANLFEQGLSSVEIYDAVIEVSKPYVKSHEQLMRCLSSIKGKVILKRKRKKTIQVKRFNVPRQKSSMLPTIKAPLDS